MPVLSKTEHVSFELLFSPRTAPGRPACVQTSCQLLLSELTEQKLEYTDKLQETFTISDLIRKFDHWFLRRFKGWKDGRSAFNAPPHPSWARHAPEIGETPTQWGLTAPVPERSPPCSQENVVGPCLEPDGCSPALLKTFSILFSTTRSFQVVYLLRVSLLWIVLLPHACHIPRPSHSSWPHYPNNIYELQSSETNNFLHSAVSSFLLSLNIPISTLSSNTPSLPSVLN